MKRLRMTVTYEYDADPEFYETDDPERMAEVDMPQWLDLLIVAAQEDAFDEDRGESCIQVKIEEAL